jgi:hypothetical protein
VPPPPPPLVVTILPAPSYRLATPPSTGLVLYLLRLTQLPLPLLQPPLPPAGPGRAADRAHRRRAPLHLPPRRVPLVWRRRQVAPPPRSAAAHLLRLGGGAAGHRAGGAPRLCCHPHDGVPHRVFCGTCHHHCRFGCAGRQQQAAGSRLLPDQYASRLCCACGGVVYPIPLPLWASRSGSSS